MTQAKEIIETKSAFARRLGISRQAVGQHAAASGFPLTPDGRVKVEQAIEFLARNVSGRSAAPSDGEQPSLIDAKIELLRVQIARGKLSLEKERSEVIPYAAARKALGGFMRLYRDICLQFAVRHGPAIAAEIGCEEGPLIAALSAHMRHALHEASGNRRPFPKAEAPAARQDKTHVR